MNKTSHSRRLRVGDAEIELLESKSHEFIGLGRVKIGGVPVRSDARPITVKLETPDGVVYGRLIVEKIKRAANRIEIVMQAVGVPDDRQEYCDDYGQSTLALRGDIEPVADRLTLILCPATLAMGGRQWSGFSYSFAFTSHTRQIHRLLTHATWEIGGRITGNTVLSQGQCNMPVYRGAKNKLFTTTCLRTLDQYGQPQGNSFQLGPRAGLIQGFDFQFAKAGALLQWWPEFDSISSLIESPPGSDLLHVVDEYRFELTRQVTTTPKWVLFTPGPFAEHAARDLWWDALEHVYGSVRKQFRVAPTVVLPEMEHAFESVLKNRTGRRAGNGKAGLYLRFAGQEVHHTEMLYAMADHLLPRLAKQGIRRWWGQVISESDVTAFGMSRKLDEGIHGGLFCSSVCSTHRFYPAEFWGGMKAWKYYYAKGRALGIEIGHWFAPHFSPRGALFQKHPEYLMLDRMGLLYGGGYGQAIIAADWNTGVYDATLDDLKRWHDEGGLDYLWVDSFSNMGLLQMNYAARMRTNYAAFARFLSDVQRAGIKTLTFESVSALGCARFGLADLRGDLLEQNRAVAGQNDFGWWVGEEDMLFNCCLGVGPRKRTTADLERIFFRTLANRGYLMWCGFSGIEHLLPEWCTRLNHVYNQALPHMQGRRRLLPDDAGVRWENKTGDLIWTFKDWRLTGNQPIQRLDGKTERVWTQPVLPAWNIFRISK